MRPVVLCILDGWGLSPSREAQRRGARRARRTSTGSGRAARTRQLAAHGPDVGLPEGQMGNSEVGHTNIGAGRVVWMDLPRIDNAIGDGSFAANPRARALHRGAEGERRHGASRRARLAGRGARAPAAHRGGGGGDRGGGRAGGGARLPRRPRRAAVERAPGRSPSWRRRCRRARGSPRSRGGSTRWTATSAGSGWRRRRRRSCAARGRARRAPSAAIAAAYARGETDEFVTPTVIGDYAGRAGRRRAVLRQLPRRPGAARSSARWSTRSFDGFAVEAAADVGGGARDGASIPTRSTG